MTTAVRWTIGVVALALVVCMLIWARGDDHRRGDDVGSLGTAPAIAGP